MTELKKQMLVSAEKNLKNYEKLLETLKRSNLEDKAIRIKECEHAIQKQKQIISNIKSYMNDTPDTVIMNEGGIKMKKTTIRIEDELHKKIMKYLIDKDMSFQEYVMELIAQDMNNHKMPHKDKKK